MSLIDRKTMLKNLRNILKRKRRMDNLRKFSTLLYDRRKIILPEGESKEIDARHVC